VKAARAKSGSPARPRIPSVPAPKRRLSRDAEQALTPRQLEVLDALEAWVLRGGIADVTMAEIAKEVECSLRTLYGIAPSKDELVLTVLDRRLHRIGRDAIRALESDEPPLARLRAYLRATNLAVQPATAAFSRDFARFAGAQELNAAHADYIVAVTRALLDEAREAGEIRTSQTAAIAHVLGRLGHEFSAASLTELVEGADEAPANVIADLLIAGLQASRDT
jgi:AcrR family transcriptional regulator